MQISVVVSTLALCDKVRLFVIDTDVDECAAQNGGCPQRCTNSVGNYTCSCFSGYGDVYNDGTLCTGNDIGLLITAQMTRRPI